MGTNYFFITAWYCQQEPGARQLNLVYVGLSIITDGLSFDRSSAVKVQ